jgi:DNA-binding MarR family transcriptional regulator
MPKRKRLARKTLTTDARQVIDVCAGINLSLAARRITRFFDTWLAEANLSIAQFALMAHVAAAPENTIGALAERSGLDQSTLSRNLRALAQEDLVEIALVEKDLRRRAVWLTERGARRLEAAIPVWRRAHRALGNAIELSFIHEVAAATLDLADMDPGVPSTAERHPLPHRPGVAAKPSSRGPTRAARLLHRPRPSHQRVS